jgi:hypothetical protein
MKGQSILSKATRTLQTLLATSIFASSVSAQTPGFVNLSARLPMGEGANAPIVGFVPNENATPMLIRAIGPGLKTFGLDNHAIDPRMDIFYLGNSTPIAVNNNWSDNQAVISQKSAQVGAFALNPGSLDSAYFGLFDARPTTPVLSSTVGDRNIVLAEAYTTDQNKLLANVSARGQAGSTDERSVIVGAVAPMTMTLGVRALAQTLTDRFGLGESNGLIVGLDVYALTPSGNQFIRRVTNSDLATDQLMQTLGAFATLPANYAKEAGLNLTVPKDTILTFNARDVNGKEGVILVETYAHRFSYDASLQNLTLVPQNGTSVSVGANTFVSVSSTNLLSKNVHGGVPNPVVVGYTSTAFARSIASDLGQSSANMSVFVPTAANLTIKGDTGGVAQIQTTPISIPSGFEIVDGFASKKVTVTTPSIFYIGGLGSSGVGGVRNADVAVYDSTGKLIRTITGFSSADSAVRSQLGLSAPQGLDAGGLVELQPGEYEFRVLASDRAGVAKLEFARYGDIIIDQNMMPYTKQFVSSGGFSFIGARGISGANPSITIKQNGSVVASNDTVSTADSAVASNINFALGPNDAGLVRSLPAGTYTVEVTGVGSAEFKTQSFGDVTLVNPGQSVSTPVRGVYVFDTNTALGGSLSGVPATSPLESRLVSGAGKVGFFREANSSVLVPSLSGAGYVVQSVIAVDAGGSLVAPKQTLTQTLNSGLYIITGASATSQLGIDAKLTVGSETQSTVADVDKKFLQDSGIILNPTSAYVIKHVSSSEQVTAELTDENARHGLGSISVTRVSDAREGFVKVGPTGTTVEVTFATPGSYGVGAWIGSAGDVTDSVLTIGSQTNDNWSDSKLSTLGLSAKAAGLLTTTTVANQKVSVTVSGKNGEQGYARIVTAPVSNHNLPTVQLGVSTPVSLKAGNAYLITARGNDSLASQGVLNAVVDPVLALKGGYQDSFDVYRNNDASQSVKKSSIDSAVVAQGLTVLGPKESALLLYVAKDVTLQAVVSSNTGEVGKESVVEVKNLGSFANIYSTLPTLTSLNGLPTIGGQVSTSKKSAVAQTSSDLVILGPDNTFTRQRLSDNSLISVGSTGPPISEDVTPEFWNGFLSAIGKGMNIYNNETITLLADSPNPAYLRTAVYSALTSQTRLDASWGAGWKNLPGQFDQLSTAYTNSVGTAVHLTLFDATQTVHEVDPKTGAVSPALEVPSDITTRLKTVGGIETFIDAKNERRYIISYDTPGKADTTFFAVFDKNGVPLKQYGYFLSGSDSSTKGVSYVPATNRLFYTVKDNLIGNSSIASGYSLDLKN